MWLSVALMSLLSMDTTENDNVLNYTRRQINLYRMFLPISQSILNRFWWNFATTIFESRGNYSEIVIKKILYSSKVRPFGM